MISLKQSVLDVSRLTYTEFAMVRFTETAHQELAGPCLTGEKDETMISPVRMWIVQVGVIMMTTQLVYLLFRKIHQPRVIAEVLGGIILSPSVFGRIPGFTKAIFPEASKPYLALVANIGLVLFLFLVGLEIDGGVIRRNARLSASIALGGMVIPFALGSALSIALYNEFIDPSIKFTHFLLFIGVAFSITAFPVLCRILAELKLFDTTVGVVVLSAGVANDIVGWTLLALSVALAKAASGLTALWILLACIGWSMLLLFPMRRIVYWLARRTGSIEHGPNMAFMTVTMLMVLCSALFTDIIGVHAIFGSFLVGLIIPREGGLTIALTEKLDDMVSILFLPLYFTLSGLSTNFGLLNNGITWAYTIAIVFLAWVGKFGGCAAAARLCGFQWREAASIGTLMSCKGLVELIVLNVGLSAGILNTLVLTFLTTPVIVALYPPKYRKRAVASGASYDRVEDALHKDDVVPRFVTAKQDRWKARFTVVLHQLEHVPSVMTMVQLFRPPVLQISGKIATTHPSSNTGQDMASSSIQSTAALPPAVIDALRLVELSDRASAVMKSSLGDKLVHTDPILDVFRAFCDASGVPVSASLSVAPFGDLATKVADRAKETLSHLILVPWLIHSPSLSDTTGLSVAPEDHKSVPVALDGAGSMCPTASRSNSEVDDQSHWSHSQFVRGIFAQSSVDVALFVDRGRAMSGHQNGQHVIFPFFGGPDDRLALAIVMQLCRNSGTTAKIFRVVKDRSATNCEDGCGVPHTMGMDTGTVPNGQDVDGHTTPGFPDIVYSNTTTQDQLQSETADNVLWRCLASPSSSLSPAIRAALDRIEFDELESSMPLQEVLTRVNVETDIALKRGARPFIVVGRTQRFATQAHHDALERLLQERGHVVPDVRGTIGDVAMAFVVLRSATGVMVLQSANP